MNRLAQWLLYLLDPVFRGVVKRKRGPNDHVGTGERVVALLSKGSGPKQAIRGGRG